MHVTLPHPHPHPPHTGHYRNPPSLTLTLPTQAIIVTLPHRHPHPPHTGLYRGPVATLDFASLYPSLFRAHNLCYTTLVHPDDVAGLGGRAGGRLGHSPTGHVFVRQEVRGAFVVGMGRRSCEERNHHGRL